MQQIELININEIEPYENNPRKNSEAVDKVAASIKEFGFKNPILLDKDKVIIAGHTRYAAAKQLGLTDVPCVVCSDLTEEQVKALRLADNKTAEFSFWDENLLDEELSGIFDIDMESFGFSFDVEDTEEKSVDMPQESFQIIIDCENENEAEEKYNKIQELGIICRISTL